MTDTLQKQKGKLTMQYMDGDWTEEEFKQKMLDLEAQVELSDTGTGLTPEQMLKKATSKVKEHTTKKNRKPTCVDDMKHWENVVRYKKEHS